MKLEKDGLFLSLCCCQWRENRDNFSHVELFSSLLKACVLGYILRLCNVQYNVHRMYPSSPKKRTTEEQAAVLGTAQICGPE